LRRSIIRNLQQGDIDGSWNCEIIMTLYWLGLKVFEMSYWLKQYHKFTLSNNI
jgi:hypothetical protein